MGNDSSSKVISIGNAQIKMHDGTIRILSDVKYVPDLRKNLISLSSIVTGEIGHPSSIAESKSTRLERRQLGYRREKCMTVLLKRGSLLDVGFEKLGHCVREIRSEWRCGNMSQGGDFLSMTPIPRAHYEMPVWFAVTPFPLESVTPLLPGLRIIGITPPQRRLPIPRLFIFSIPFSTLVLNIPIFPRFLA
ncbi:hypothetical protein Goshw_001330, partial [Gossypium schwendimanii]|nr:hypothetical protein [Gossypium schwendimanii]